MRKANDYNVLFAILSTGAGGRSAGAGSRSARGLVPRSGRLRGDEAGENPVPLAAGLCREHPGPLVEQRQVAVRLLEKRPERGDLVVVEAHRDEAGVVDALPFVSGKPAVVGRETGLAGLR